MSDEEKLMALEFYFQIIADAYSNSVGNSHTKHDLAIALSSTIYEGLLDEARGL